MLISKIQKNILKNIIFLIITFLFFVIAPNIHAANNWYYATMSGSANVSPAYGGFSETQCNTLRQTRITTGLASGENWDVTPCVLVTKTPPVMGSDLNATFTYIQDLVASGEIKQYWLEYQNNTSNIYTIMGPFESIQSCNGWWSTGGNNGNTLTKPCFESKTTPIATTTPENPAGENTIDPDFFLTPNKLKTQAGQSITITVFRKMLATHSSSGMVQFASSPTGGIFSKRNCTLEVAFDGQRCTVNFSSNTAGTFSITGILLEQLVAGGDFTRHNASLSIEFTESNTLEGDGTGDTAATNTNYVLMAPLPDGSGGQFLNFESDATKNPCAFGKYMNIILKIFLGICAVLAMLMIIWGGIEYMGSSLPSGKESGRGTITNAILGLILALGAYLIIFTINPNLLNFCLDQQLPTVDILINGESTINPEPISTTEIIKTTGINCPGSGGISQLSPISKSFIEHVTYNKSKRNKRDSSTLYFDCSSFVSQVYSCAGLTRPGNNTNDMFTNGNKDTNVSGIKAGDLLGWKKGESSKYPKSGHVFMSLGGDSIIEVSNPPGGVNTNAHIASLNHYASEVKHIIRIK